MKGVLLKDLYIAGSNVVVTVIMLTVLGFGLSFLMEPSAILILAPGITTIPAFISITSDVAAKWNKNVITMPLSRNKVIGEKYLLYSILAVLGLLLSIVICIILGLFGEKVSLDTLCLYGVIGMSATFLAGGLSLPCAYFFDADIIYSVNRHYHWNGAFNQYFYTCKRICSSDLFECFFDIISLVCGFILCICEDI